MTGPEHYREAESHLSTASYLDRPNGRPVDPEGAAHHLAAAQVHATLALAAATALPAPRHGSAQQMSWVRAAHGIDQVSGTPEEASR